MHSCSGLGDPARVGVQKAMSMIRQRGASTMEKPAQIRAAAAKCLLAENKFNVKEGKKTMRSPVHLHVLKLCLQNGT
ncbi:unnamed protein product [Meloidogyne enterolobii]|uniref:Uncharacterized protein n=1 Tax=Meloidogyne enterolobii TaxID=390850 RepID=A0ACB0XZR4_MELEN